MKFTTTACLGGKIGALVVSSIALVHLAAGQPSGVTTARDVVSEEALQQQATSVPGLKAMLAAKAKPAEKAPALRSSLWTHSIILSDGEMFTLVPVGSILHLPASLRNRVVAAPVGNFTFWPAFLRRNASWLAGHDVTLEMSRGDRKAARALLKSISKDERVLVAVYKGGPITILEPVTESPAGKSP